MQIKKSKNQILPFILTIVVTLLLSSCEKQDVDTSSSDVQPIKVPVIDAVLDMYKGTCEVKVGETENAIDKSPESLISGLVITLKYDNKTTAIFKEVEKGVYLSEKIQTASGKTYELTIKKLKSQNYIATAVSPELVVPSIDNVKESDKTKSQVLISWQDPKGKENYYWPSVRTNNSSKKETLTLVSDSGNDGKSLSSFVYLETKEISNSKVELLNIDAFTYKYKGQILGSESFPKSNFDKAVNGVFSIINYQPLNIK